MDYGDERRCVGYKEISARNKGTVKLFSGLFASAGLVAHGVKEIGLHEAMGEYGQIIADVAEFSSFTLAGLIYFGHALKEHKTYWGLGTRLLGLASVICYAGADVAINNIAEATESVAPIVKGAAIGAGLALAFFSEAVQGFAECCAEREVTERPGVEGGYSMV